MSYLTDHYYPQNLRQIDIPLSQIPESLRPEWWVIRIPLDREEMRPNTELYLVGEAVIQKIYNVFFVDRNALDDEGQLTQIPATFRCCDPGFNWDSWVDGDEGNGEIISEIEHSPSVPESDYGSMEVSEFEALEPQSPDKEDWECDRICLFRWQDDPRSLEMTIEQIFDAVGDGIQSRLPW